MAITDYASLQTEIGGWLHRTDMAAQIPTFISIAEAKMQGDIESRQMDARVTLTCTPGPTLAARLVALPTDLVEMRRLMLATEPARVLDYKTPEQLAADRPALLTPGIPLAFSVVAGNIELSPPPDSAYALELVYQQRIPALSASNTTNWLLAQSPNVYLFGALIASTSFTLDETHLPAFEREYQRAVSTINKTDWYSGTSMVVRAR